jgi:hypothetical protein
MRLNLYNFRKRLRSNYHKLEDFQLRKDIEELLIEYPFPKQAHLTTSDIKNLTKCLSHSIKTGHKHDDTMLVRAYAYCKEAARRVESKECELEGMIADTKQAGILLAHILTYGANFIEIVASRSQDPQERTELRKLIYDDMAKSLAVASAFEDDKTPNSHIQAANIARNISYDCTGEERREWMQKEADNLAAAADLFSDQNKQFGSKLYADAAKTEMAIANGYPKKKKALEKAYEYLSKSFETAETLDHPCFTERYIRRAETAKQAIELSEGDEKIEWMLRAIYDTLCVADRQTNPELAAKEYSIAGRLYFRAAAASCGNKKDEIEFAQSAIEITKKALETSRQAKYDLGVAIASSNIGRYLCLLHSVTQDKQHAKQSAKYFEAVESYFTKHPSHDNSGYLLHAQRALRWIKAMRKENNSERYKEQED